MASDVKDTLHAAASDLRFMASGGQCAPETLRAHADALLALLPTPAVGAAGEPVAWALYHDENPRPWTVDLFKRSDEDVGVGNRVVPLYAHPSAGAGVTEEMVEAGIRVGRDWGFFDWSEEPTSRYKAMREVLTAALTTRPTSEGREDV